MKEDLQDFCDMWDAACEEGIFDSPHQEEDSNHYNYLSGTEVAEDLLQEDTTPNPIYPNSVDPDYERPKPTWVDMDNFEKLESLKKKLYDLECSLGAKEAKKTDKKVPGKISTKITSLKKQIDKLSDSIGLEDEPEQSMYKVRPYAKRKPV